MVDALDLTENIKCSTFQWKPYKQSVNIKAERAGLIKLYLSVFILQLENFYLHCLFLFTRMPL